MIPRTLIDQVTTNVGAGMFASKISDYSSRGIHGFSEYKDQRLLQEEIFSSQLGSDRLVSWGGLIYKPCVAPLHLEQRGVNEAVALEYITRNTYNPVTRFRPSSALWGWAGKLGIQELYQHDEKNGERPILHKELVQNGQSEQACLLQYGAFDAKDERLYCFGGRSGQILWIDMVLPKSIGERTFAAIEESPLFARALIEQVVLQNFKIEESYWRQGPRVGENQPTPLRPPYEQWAQMKDGATKLAIVKPGAPLANGGSEGWREYAIVVVR